MQLTATDVAIYKSALKTQVPRVHWICDYLCHRQDPKWSLSTA